MNNRYLLYIDILGFSDMVLRNDKCIDDICNYLDNNSFLQKHSFMSRIIFSDTILFFNTYDTPPNDPNLKNVIGDMLELCQILIWYFVPHNIFFRGIITSGSFDHKKYENSEYFYGKALIDSYITEKKMPITGVVIDKKLQKYNAYFKSCSLNEEFDYVYLTNALIHASQIFGDTMHLVIEADTSEAGFVNRETEFLKQVHYHMNNNSNINIRAKHALTWILYKKYLKNIMEEFELHDFSLKKICTYIDWDKELEEFTYFD